MGQSLAPKVVQGDGGRSKIGHDVSSVISHGWPIRGGLHDIGRVSLERDSESVLSKEVTVIRGHEFVGGKADSPRRTAKC